MEGKETGNIRQIIRHGRILGFPVTRPEGTTGSVAYEVGKAFQLDRDHILLTASMDEQGGADLCVGNDGFVIQKLADISPEKAIPINRPDPAYRLKSGEVGFLGKFSVNGGFVPLGAKFEDGQPHPAAGTGFLVSAGFASTDLRNLLEDQEPVLELIQVRWNGESLKITGRELTKKLCGLELNGDKDIAYFLPQAAGFLAPLGVKEKGVLVFRFEWDGKAWTPVAHGEPFVVGPEGEFEPSIQKDKNGRYLVYTRGNDPYGRLYLSEDGLNYKFLSAHPNHTVPQVLNQGLDGSLYLTTNQGPGWIRNPLLAYPMTGDSFGEPFVLHDEDGIRGDEGDKIPFVDIAVGVNLFMENRWRHFIFYRVCDLKERRLQTPDSAYEKDVHGDSGPIPRRETDGIYAIEVEYDKIEIPRVAF